MTSTMPPADDLILAELLCARLCHDLAGPVGAAAAGAELLEDSADFDRDTVALVAASAAAIAARLKFFRAAFGPGGRDQDSQGLRGLIRDYLDSSTSTAAPALGLEWRVEATELPAATARLLLNLALIARDGLPRGGGIELALSGRRASVIARGHPVGLAEEARAVLIDGAAATGPKGAQALLTRRLAEAMESRLDVHIASETLTFTVDIRQRR